MVLRKNKTIFETGLPATNPKWDKIELSVHFRRHFVTKRKRHVGDVKAGGGRQVTRPRPCPSYFHRSMQRVDCHHVIVMDTHLTSLAFLLCHHRKAGGAIDFNIHENKNNSDGRQRQNLWHVLFFSLHVGGINPLLHAFKFLNFFLKVRYLGRDL